MMFDITLLDPMIVSLARHLLISLATLAVLIGLLWFAGSRTVSTDESPTTESSSVSSTVSNPCVTQCKSCEASRAQDSRRGNFDHQSQPYIVPFETNTWAEILTDRDNIAQRHLENCSCGETPLPQSEKRTDSLREWMISFLTLQ
jgi:hypothetical protein